MLQALRVSQSSALTGQTGGPNATASISAQKINIVSTACVMLLDCHSRLLPQQRKQRRQQLWVVFVVAGRNTIVPSHIRQKSETHGLGFPKEGGTTRRTRVCSSTGLEATASFPRSGSEQRTSTRFGNQLRNGIPEG